MMHHGPGLDHALWAEGLYCWNHRKKQNKHTDTTCAGIYIEKYIKCWGANLHKERNIDMYNSNYYS